MSLLLSLAAAAARAHCAEPAQCHDHLLQAQEPGHLRTLLQEAAGAQPRAEGGFTGAVLVGRACGPCLLAWADEDQRQDSIWDMVLWTV
jgi:hypothetical protein